MKRKNQNKHYHASVVTLKFTFVNICQIISSSHASQTYVNNQLLAVYILRLLKRSDNRISKIFTQVINVKTVNFGLLNLVLKFT